MCLNVCGLPKYWPIIGTIWILLVERHDAAAIFTSGYCTIPSEHDGLSEAYDLRCARHNYSDFRDTHFFDIYAYGSYQGQLKCKLNECGAPLAVMMENCPENLTRECLKASHMDPTKPECFYLPSEFKDILMPSLYELRISDELYLQNQILVREARGREREMIARGFFYIVNSTYNYIRSGRGNETHCIEMEKSIDWCNDASKKRSFNGTYVLCREEKDLWRVMSEFGRRAPHCIRYYIRKHFLQTKKYAAFKRDMTVVCSKFEQEMQNNNEKDIIEAHTTERHSIAINTFNACCFLRKAAIIERFPCVEEATTPWPETPAPTVELRNESNILVLSIEENGLNSYSKLLIWSTVLLLLLC